MLVLQVPHGKHQERPDRTAHVMQQPSGTVLPKLARQKLPRKRLRAQHIARREVAIHNQPFEVTLDRSKPRTRRTTTGETNDISLAILGMFTIFW